MFFFAIIMLFRIAFYLIQMVVSPEAKKSSKSGSSLPAKVFIVIALALFLPTIFNFGREVQVVLLEEGVIRNLFVPEGSTSTSESFDDGKTMRDGDEFVWYTLSSVILDANSKIDPDTNEIKSSATYQAFEADIRSGKYRGILGYTKILYYLEKKTLSEFDLQYFYFVSTIALIVVFLFLLTTNIDIGLRTINLLVLEMISPIALATYLEFGQKESMFQRWVKQYLKVFFDYLFP